MKAERKKTQNIKALP